MQMGTQLSIPSPLSFNESGNFEWQKDDEMLPLWVGTLRRTKVKEGSTIRLNRVSGMIGHMITVDGEQR